MLGVILAAIGGFFEELSASIGKEEVRRKVESVYAMGFLNSLWGVVFFAVLTAWNYESLTFAAWPTFLLRAVSSVTLAYFSVNAIAQADRSTFAFIRTGTIPLLIIADLLLGSTLGGAQLLGMGVIAVGLLFLSVNHGFSKKGMMFTIASTINAAIAIGLYKYNITHGNSVVLEQLLSITVLILYFAFMCKRSGEKPLLLLKKPLVALQSGSIGIATLFDSFAYQYAPSSVILATTRSASVVFSVLSGAAYFHEKHMAVKIVSIAAFVGGIVLLAAG